MLNIPSSVKALFQADGVHKNFRVHFPNGEMADITNDNVVQESVKFTESLCSQSTFKFGLAEASVLEFETVGIGNMYGMTIQASCEIDCSSLSAADKAAIAAGTWDGTWDAVNEVFAVPYGVFRVQSCPRDHQSMAHRQVTAYTRSAKETVGMAGLPTDTFFSKASVAANAFSALYGIGLSAPETFQADDNTPAVTAALFDSSGKRYMISALAMGTPAEKISTLNGYNSADGALREYDFAKVELPFSLSDYYQQGVSAANALTAAGYNLTYNSNKEKIYSTNLEALQSRMPWLFSPVLLCQMSDSSYNSLRLSCGYFNIVSGRLFAVPQTERILPQRTGAVSLIQNGFLSDYSVYYHWGRAGSGEARLIGNEVNSSGDVTGNGFNVAFTAADTSGDVNITAYQITPSNVRVELNGDSLGRKESTFYQPVGTSKLKPMAIEAFAASTEEAHALFEAWIEIAGMFAKVNRNGEEVVMALDPDSAIQIQPDDYSQCWWDEFDIDPIGTITVTYKEMDENNNPKESTTDIVVGGGQSRYDMAANSILKNLANASLADVTEMLNTFFVPQAGTVSFTPAELSMVGCPWIEAGDALQIEAEDGTIVNTYALRIEMSGIQNLQAVITAEGGEIIEEVE